MGNETKLDNGKPVGLVLARGDMLPESEFDMSSVVASSVRNTFNKPLEDTAGEG